MSRIAIEVPGLHHAGAPIPQASKVGSLLISSGINGMDTRTGTVPESLEQQVGLVFENVRLIMDQAAGSTDDIVKCTFFVRDRSARQHIDVHWNDMFPDEASRPARHTLTVDLHAPLLIQCEITAHIEGPHHDH